MKTKKQNGSVRLLFRDWNFVRYFLGDTIAVAADNAFFIFLLWAGQQASGNPAVVGGLLTVHIIPRILLKLYGGKIADSYPPQRILFVCTIVQAIVLVGFYSWLHAGHGSVVLALFVVAALFGVVNAFLLPAANSVLPRIVSDQALQNANRIIETTGYGAQFVGIALAGLLLVGGIGVAAGGIACLYVAACILFLSVKVMPQTVTLADNDTAENTEKPSIIKGLQYVWQTPVLRASTMLVFVTSLAVKGPINIGLLLLITDKLQLSSVMFSNTYLLYSLGGLLVGLALGGTYFRAPGRIMVLEFIAMGIIFIVLGFYANLVLVAIGFFALGALSVLSAIVGRTWQQKHTAKNKYGAAASAIGLSEIALEPVSRSLTGLLAAWSLTGMFVLSGGYLIVATICVIAYNKVLLRHDEKTTHGL